ncbi:hypothetical protein BOQ62_00640 [Chryseobacterium sp. CH21]|nr:hypothetical protein BOQ62_00640 [Chryseobacterium sp. CH21]
MSFNINGQSMVFRMSYFYIFELNISLRKSYELQFSDESHLSKLFKKYRGVTPGEYKKSFK